MKLGSSFVVLTALVVVLLPSIGHVGLAHSDNAQTTNDRYVLVTLYNATDGPNWANNTNWLSDKPISQWHGIRTDSNGRVTDLNLESNRLSGEIPSELGSLPNLTSLWLGNNPLVCIPESLLLLREALSSTDIDNLPECADIEIVLTVNGDPLLYNDNLFVLPVGERLNESSVPIRGYSARFYEYFRDDFDFLIFVSNLSVFDLSAEEFKLPYGGAYFAVTNDTRGIGTAILSDHRKWGSDGQLQGAIHLGEIEGTSQNILLHELIHRWANFIVPTNYGAHWGFSSANGLLGGFEIDDLVDYGDRQYSVGPFVPDTAREGDHKPYSPIELYLAGLIPPEEVPDLWVAEDGRWPDDFEFPIDGDWLFTASRVKTYTIEDLISKHGKRIPDYTRSQRDFQAAVILLIDEDNPLTKGRLDKVSSDIAQFSHAGTDEFNAYNFYEATGGRATIAIGGLSQSLKNTGQTGSPGAPRGLTATGNALPGVELSWSAPENQGDLTVTSYDLRYIEISDDETMESNWTVVEDVWTFGSAAMQYTHSGLTPDTQYDFQVRAVHALGPGPWSTTAVATPVPVPTPTPTNTPTTKPSPTPSIAPTHTPTNTPAPTPTVAPTHTPTLTPNNTPTAIPSSTPTVAPTHTPTLAPTATLTVTPSSTLTVAPTHTPTLAPTATLTATPSPTPTITPTHTLTATPIATTLEMEGRGTNLGMLIIVVVTSALTIGLLVAVYMVIRRRSLRV